MCFITEIGAKKQIAKEDIICYKRVIQYLLEDEQIVHSLYGSFTYILGKLYDHSKRWNILHTLVSYNEMHINRGFHSYIRKAHLFEKGYSYVECTIPKGAKYYVNYNEYVSDKIIINKIISEKVLRENPTLSTY